ncbi:hypothetical protein ACOME3_001616 [Neoechinorhynchus agilis]
MPMNYLPSVGGYNSDYGSNNVQSYGYMESRKHYPVNTGYTSDSQFGYQQPSAPMNDIQHHHHHHHQQRKIHHFPSQRRRNRATSYGGVPVFVQPNQVLIQPQYPPMTVNYVPEQQDNIQYIDRRQSHPAYTPNAQIIDMFVPVATT